MTIAIPTFGGVKTVYQSWRTAFMQCIDSTDITEEFKLLHLRECLDGEAAESIRNLGHSAESYHMAKAVLDNR